jgi:hypothetical protein
MRNGNHGLGFSGIEKHYINKDEGKKSFTEAVNILRRYARERLEKEDDLATLVSRYSKSIPDEEMCEKLAKSKEWQLQRVVEGPMVRALIEEYTDMKRG